MAEVDPVVLQLIADNSRYLSELRRTTQTADQQLGIQQRKVQALETQMKRSSGEIAGSLRGMAGAFAAAFSATQVIGLVDDYTRLQNSLKVTGLEGVALASVQERLYELNGRYGVSVNALAGLYSNASQSAAEFGASQGQILDVTEAVAQSLLITGKSQEQAAGAILGLEQALGSARVSAEEFNQINEGGLRPLLQAAAAGDKFGGSVTKLRAYMKETGVSGQEFFNMILAGSDGLSGKANQAVLTIGASFTVLNDQLGRYLGEAGAANGATGALAEGIKGLANNLDTIIPALSVIATIMGGRFVAGALAGGTALRAVAAHAAIATTSLAGTALAARSAGAALLGAFGGPVGLAITAVGAALYYVYTQTNKAREASEVYQAVQSRVDAAATSASDAIDKLATAHGRARVEALRNAQAQQKSLEAMLAVAMAFQFNAQAELQFSRSRYSRAREESQGAALAGGEGGALAASQIITSAEADLQQRTTDLIAATNTLRGVTASVASGREAIASATAPIPGVAPSPRTAGAAGSTGGVSSGPSPTDIEQRRNDNAERAAQELARIDQEIISARIALSDNAEERLDLEAQALRAEHAERLAQIDNSAEYTDLQKQAQRDALARLYGELEGSGGTVIGQPGLFQRQLSRAYDEEITQQRLEQLRLDADALDATAGIADTLAERRALDASVLDIQQQIERELLEQSILNGQITDADRARSNLAAIQVAQREGLRRSNEGPLARYAREANGDIETEIESLAVDKIRSINDTIAGAMADEFGIKDKFIRQIIGLFLQQAVFGPLSQALSQAGGQGGGFSNILQSIGPALASIFGGARANGGPVSSGKAYLVGERGPEIFAPSVSGSIIPNHAIGGKGGGVVRLQITEAPGFAARVQVISADTAVEVTRQSAPGIINAAVGETFRQSGRPSI